MPHRGQTVYRPTEPTSNKSSGALAPILCTLIVMVDGYDLQVIAFIAPELMRLWGEPASAFGPVFAAGLAGAIPGAIAAGPAARLFGVRGALTAAIALFGLGTFALLFASQLDHAIAIRFAIGIGLGATIPIVVSLIAEAATPRLRSTLIVIALCGQPIGAALGALLCAWLVPAYGWQSAIVVGGLAPIVLAPLVWLISRPAQALAKQKTALFAGLLRRDLRGVTLLLWSAIFLLVPATYIVVNWLPIIMDRQGHTFAASMHAMSVLNGAAVIGAIGIGVLMDRFGAFFVLTPALIVAGIALFALGGLTDRLALFYAALALAGLTAGGAGAGMGALTIAAYPPPLRTTGAGLVFGIGRVGGALGPLCVGAALAAGFEATHLFAVAAIAALAVAALLWLLARERRTQRDSEAA